MTDQKDPPWLASPETLAEMRRGSFYGKPIGDMNTDELLTVIAFLSDEARAARQSHKQSLDFFRAAREARESRQLD